MSRKIKLTEGKLNIQDKITTIYEKTVTRFGTGAKIDCPKEFLGKRVYVMIRGE
jgi:putative transposon-encoded protein